MTLASFNSSGRTAIAFCFLSDIAVIGVQHDDPYSFPLDGFVKSLHSRRLKFEAFLV